MLNMQQNDQAIQFKEKGAISFKEQKYKDAIDFFQQSLALIKEQDLVLESRLLSNIGICYYNLNDKKQSKESFKLSIEKDESFQKPYVYLSKIYQELNEFQKSFEYYEKIKEKFPEIYSQNQYNFLSQKKNEQFEQQKKEALSGLKDLGNSILGKFGISLDNFKLNQQQDGSYSVNYQNQQQLKIR